MSLEVGTVVQYGKGIAIVYATYPASNQLGLKFLDKQLEVVTETVTETSVSPAITTKNTYNVINNIQTKNDEYFKETLLKLNKIANTKPKVTQLRTSASQRRVMPSRRTAAEMLSHRYSSSSSSDEDDEFDITKFKLAEGRRSRRRKSRRHKKTNRRRKSQRNKK